MIYLDNAATTPVAPEVLNAMLPYFLDRFGNAGSLHTPGREAKAAVDTARERVAGLLRCVPEQVVFTSGGSEGNSLAVKGLRRRLLERGKNHIVLSATEHESTIRAARSLTKDGFYISFVKPDQAEGTVTADLVAREIRPNTGLVSVMYVNNETGIVNDVESIGALCRERSILFHSDLVQAAGQFEIDAEKFCLDFATVSAHKICGPKGAGALFVREPGLLEPLICGGREQEFALRGGTENVPAIAGFGRACALASERLLLREDLASVTSNKQLFVRTLLEEQGCDGIHPNVRSHLRPGKILSLRADGVSGETLVLMLDACGVCISAGSACHARSSSPSHVLLSHGLTEEEAGSSVRVSFSGRETPEEVRQAARFFAGAVETLRKAGPVGE